MFTIALKKRIIGRKKRIIYLGLVGRGLARPQCICILLLYASTCWVSCTLIVDNDIYDQKQEVLPIDLTSGRSRRGGATDLLERFIPSLNGG